MRALTCSLLLCFCAAAARAQAPSASCSTALDYHYYALQVLGQCEDPATQNSTLCELVGEFYESATYANASSVGHTAHAAVDQLPMFINPDSSIQPWQDYLAQSAMTQTAEIGQIAYLRSRINAAWLPLNGSADLTDDQYSGEWGRAWWALGDDAFAAAGNASNGWDWQSRRDAYLKAANYFFTGQWPLFTTDAALAYMGRAQEAVRLGLEQWQGVNATFFSVPFSVGGLSAELPAIFLTPDASRQLPTIVYISGTDYPKEPLLLAWAADTLERGYAAIFFDGPGQGEVIRASPHMPFTNDWAGATSPILDYATTELEQYVDSSRIAIAGYSLGGYLAGVACAGLSDRIAACIVDPGRTEMQSAYNVTTQYGIHVYGAVQYVAQQDPELLPPGYAQVFANLSNILDPILLECDAESGAPEAFAAPFNARAAGPVDPELVYLGVGYGGVFSSNASDIFYGLWAGYRSTLGFTNDHVANITVPVLNWRSLEDDLLGGEEQQFQAALSPRTRQQSQLAEFDGASGAALHDQVGAPYLSAAVQFAFLDRVMASPGTNAQATTAG